MKIWAKEAALRRSGDGKSLAYPWNCQEACGPEQGREPGDEAGEAGRGWIMQGLLGQGKDFGFSSKWDGTPRGLHCGLYVESSLVAGVKSRPKTTDTWTGMKAVEEKRVGFEISFGN